MSKIECVVIKLGNDEGTIPKFKEICAALKKTSWNWDESPKAKDLDVITDMLKWEAKRQLYVCIYPAKHLLTYNTMYSEDEDLLSSRAYWIYGVKVSSIYSFEKIAEAMTLSPSFTLSIEEAAASLKEASKKLMTFSIDTSEMREAYEKLRGIK